MFEQPEIESPCIKVCQMDKTTGLCRGCYRTEQEIQSWWDLSFEEKSALIKLIWSRQSSKA